MTIPEGYKLIPQELYESLMRKLELGWVEIKEPTISQVAEYLNIGTNKIKKDFQKIDCPLKKISKGGKGRGNEISFIKQSVEAYKDWINSK